MNPLRPKGKNKVWVSPTIRDTKSFVGRGNDKPFYNLLNYLEANL